MRLNKLRKQMKILNWRSEGFLILKGPEHIRKVWKFASIPDQWRHVAASLEKLEQDIGPVRHQRSVDVQEK